jgi:hypothetical protein
MSNFRKAVHPLSDLIMPWGIRGRGAEVAEEIVFKGRKNIVQASLRMAGEL